MKTTTGVRVQTLNHGQLILPTAAEYEAELTGRGFDVKKAGQAPRVTRARGR